MVSADKGRQPAEDFHDEGEYDEDEAEYDGEFEADFSGERWPSSSVARSICSAPTGNAQ